VLNGQKVWSTWAHHADFGYVLARTDPNSERHAGITAFALQLDQPGVEIRPIREITGTSDFCEVFLSDAAVPVANRIGADGDGWRVANESLASERFESTATADDSIDEVRSLIHLWSRIPDGTPIKDATADALVRLHERAEILGVLICRHRSRAESGEPRVADALVEKIAFSELYLDIATMGLRLLGAAGLRIEGDTGAVANGHWQDMFLYARAYTIAGGSAEVLRNVLAERQLGLPRR